MHRADFLFQKYLVNASCTELDLSVFQLYRVLFLIENEKDYILQIQWIYHILTYVYNSTIRHPKKKDGLLLLWMYR